MQFSSNKNSPLMKSIISSKIKNLFSQIPLAKNLARQTFISEFTLGVIKSRNIQFKEVGLHFTTDSKVESTERRIQAFFKDFEFDYQQVAILLLMFLPKGKLSLSIDRTDSSTTDVTWVCISVIFLWLLLDMMELAYLHFGIY